MTIYAHKYLFIKLVMRQKMKSVLFPIKWYFDTVFSTMLTLST